MKLNKAAIGSILWMSAMVVAPLLLEHLSNVQGKYAMLAGLGIALIRFWMNYKNPDDSRYGVGDKNETP